MRGEHNTMDWVREYEEKREQKAMEQSMGNKDEYHRLMDSEWDNFYTIDDFCSEIYYWNGKLFWNTPRGGAHHCALSFP